MPIVNLQRSFRELGRIRLGERGAKGAPKRLETFRLTSVNRELLERAAELYGGTVEPWETGFQLTTETDALDVIVPPGDPLSQWFELWTGGGCQIRCDGERDVLNDLPCRCPADPEERQARASKGEACRMTTRLNVLLPQLPDVGVWRLETHGYYAATELPGTVEIVQRAAGRAGGLIRAQLRLEQRERKQPGKGTRRWVVPVLAIPDRTLGQAAEGSEQLAAGQEPPRALPEAETGDRPESPATTASANGEGRSASSSARSAEGSKQSARRASRAADAASRACSGCGQIGVTLWADKDDRTKLYCETCARDVFTETAPAQTTLEGSS